MRSARQAAFFRASANRDSDLANPIPNEGDIAAMTAKQGPGPSDDSNEELPTPNRECPACGQDSTGFRTSGRLGCPLDYGVFSDEIAVVFRSSQAASLHVGKWPKRGPSPFEALKLQSEMRLAIARQDYETAALIRDRLRERNKHRET